MAIPLDEITDWGPKDELAVEVTVDLTERWPDQVTPFLLDVVAATIEALEERGVLNVDK